MDSETSNPGAARAGTTRVGAFPGTFNPPTISHLAIARAARAHCRLDRIDLVVSKQPLGKDAVDLPRFEHRVAVLDRLAAPRPWLGLRVTEQRLIVDLATGYDVVVLGADKWEQVLDPAWYGGSVAARDDALARLPRVVVVPRAGSRPAGVELLHIDPEHEAVSSTRARRGETHLMVPEARELDDVTGAWSDPERYERWLAES